MTQKGLTPKFTNQLNNFIRESDPQSNENAYNNVLNKMLDSNSLKAHQFHIYEKNGESAYANNIVDPVNSGYTSFRVSNHFPIINNIIDKVPDGYPINRKYAHICLLFFGNYELSNLDDSMKGQYALGREGTRIKIKDRATFERIKNFYSESDTFPYRIYHYIPNLLTEADVDKIISASVDWFNGKGNEEFKFPKPENDKARPAKTAMYAEIRFVINRPLRESIETTKLISSTPIYSFVIDRKKYTLENTNQSIDVEAVIDIYEISSYMLMYMKKIEKHCKQIYKRGALMRKFKK